MSNAWGGGDPNLTQQQISQTWVSCGGDPSMANVMAAIAMAESGGNPEAIGDTDTSYPSYGLWQIRSVHAGEIPNFFPSQGSNEWANPCDNASAAWSVYKSQGLDAWSTYSSGSYRKYMPGGTSFIPSQGAAPGFGGWENLPGDIVNGIEGIAGGIFNDIENFLQPLFGGMVSPFLRLPQSLINIGWNFGGFCIGIFLIALSAFFLVGGTFEEISDKMSDKADDVIAAFKNQGGSGEAAEVAEVAA